jgi:hypothetical protein
MIGRRKRPQGDRRKTPVATEAVQHTIEWMAGIHLGRAVCTDDESRCWPEPTNNVLKGFDGNLGGV